MRRRLLLLLAALLCADLASATELVRVRVSQFSGSEPATISSASHPALFVLDPSIASAELVASNPADPVKEDYGPATWFPVMTPRHGLPLEYGTIELRITPASGSIVEFGAIHFRTGALVASQPGGFWLDWSRYPSISPFGTAVDLARATTWTLLLEAAASDELTTFRWSTENNFTGTAGGAAGFTGVDVVVTSPLCEDAPRDTCDATVRASLSLDAEAGPGGKLAWSWTGEGAPLEGLGGPDAAPLFALCLYDERGLVLEAPFGPDLCGRKSCWTEQHRGFLYKNKAGSSHGVTALRQRANGRGVFGSLDAAFAYAYPNPALPLPLSAGNVQAQLVRSDGGSCFEASFSPPATTSSDFEFEDSLP